MDNKWNVDTLKEHIEKLLDEKDKAVNIALAAAKEAVGVAELNAEKWRDNANEWRGAMNDREKTFITKAEFESYKSAVDKALTIEKERGDFDKGKSSGLSLGWAIFIGAVGVVGSVVGIFFAFNK